MQATLYILLGGVVLTFLIFLVFLLNNFRLVYWSSLFCPFVPIAYLGRYFLPLPPAVKWIPFFFLSLFFGLLIIRQINRGNLFFPKKIRIFLFCLGIFGFFSIIFNKVNFFPAFFSGVGVISYIMFIFILNNKEFGLDLNSLMKVLVRFGVASSFVALFQRVFFVMLQHKTSDMITGLFSVDGQFTFYQLFCLIVVLVYWFFDKPLFKRFSNPAVGLLIIASVAMSGNVASLFFLPLIFGTIFLFVEKRKFLNKFGSFLLLFVSLIGATIIYSALWKGEFEERHGVQSGENGDLLSLITDPNFLQDYLFGLDYQANSDLAKDGTLKRGAAVVFGYSLVSISEGNMVMGRGAGSTSESTLPGAEGVINRRYEGYKIGKTSYSQVLTELGFGGLLFMLIYVIVLYRWRSSEDERSEYRVIRKTTAVILLLYFAYENVFDNMGGMLVFAALTLTMFPGRDSEKVEEADTALLND